MYKHPHILHFCIYAFTNTPELYSHNTHHFHIIMNRRSSFFFVCVLRSRYYCTSRTRHRSTALWKIKSPLRIRIPVCPLQAQILPLMKVPNSSEYAEPPYLTSSSSHTILPGYFLPISGNNYLKDVNRVVGAGGYFSKMLRVQRW